VFSLIIAVKKNGVIERELCTAKIEESPYNDLLDGIFVEESNGGQLTVKVMLTTPSEGELADWQYEAAFDYYNTGVFAETKVRVAEDTDAINPRWEISFPFCEKEFERKIAEIITIHGKEVDDVLAAINNADVEEEYSAEIEQD